MNLERERRSLCPKGIQVELSIYQFDRRKLARGFAGIGDFPSDKAITIFLKNSLDPTGRSFYVFIMKAEQPTSSKRADLVEIASELFYAQGYGATGIKQIIDTAGIAKGTFYSHFSSKEELGVAWLKSRHQVWNAWLDEGIKDARSAKGKLIAMFDFLETWMTSCDYRGCAFLNTLAEIPDPEHAMRREIESHKRDLQSKIEALVAEHSSGKSDAFNKQRALIIFLLFEGAIVETQNLRDLSLITAARKEVKSLLSTSS